ncbi:hypothetical protein JL720_14910 [Aureococcus anophagefferens]|nr:hypothetical protein JL720_14910 [Aureococcus anophagefferens]
MSAPKGTLNVERRGWDKDKYEQRAKDREEYGDEYVDGKGAEAEIRDRQEFRAAEAGAGPRRVLTEPEVQKKATGWYCGVCECLLRTTASYLDHINGKKHQRKLGYSMRVERVGVDAVRDRFADQTGASGGGGAGATRRSTSATQESGRGDQAEDPDFDAEMNAMMGFGGFGASATIGCKISRFV